MVWYVPWERVLGIDIYHFQDTMIDFPQRLVGRFWDLLFGKGDDIMYSDDGAAVCTVAIGSTSELVGFSAVVAREREIYDRMGDGDSAWDRFLYEQCRYFVVFSRLSVQIVQLVFVHVLPGAFVVLQRALVTMQTRGLIVPLLFGVFPGIHVALRTVLEVRCSMPIFLVLQVSVAFFAIMGVIAAIGLFRQTERYGVLAIGLWMCVTEVALVYEWKPQHRKSTFRTHDCGMSVRLLSN